jgi:ABC-type transport system involved in multi-copper enzyme maturation permease subunit
MTWLIWQQQRRQVIVTGIALALAAVFLGITGMFVADSYHTLVQHCSGQAHGCGSLSNATLWGGSRLSDVVVAVGFLTPFVLGIFWGAPLVAREFEEGTHRLSWTQSVSRRRWLAVHMAWTFGAAIVLVAVMTLLTTWWYSPINSAQHNRLGSAVFDSQGLVPIGYAICAIALGIAMGALLRRSVPAMGMTFLIMGVLRYATSEYLRPHLLPAKTILASLTGGGLGPLRDGWVLSQTIVNSARQPVPLLNGTPAPSAIPGACNVIQSGRQLGACLDAHGFHYFVAYQPANHYWALQGAETAMFLAIGIVFVVLSFWWISRRDA